jgi:xylulokinase
VLAPHDLLVLRLTGNLVTDPVAASATGYWSPGTREYRADLLAIVDRDRDWTSVVPRVASPGEVVGEWRGASVVIRPASSSTGG